MLKRRLSYICSICFSTFLFLQYSQAQNIQIKKTYYRGDSVLTYPSDSIEQTTVGIIPSLSDGKYFGFLYNDTADLRLVLTYLNGKIQGEYLEYFGSTHALKKRKFYINGISQGHWIEYDYSASGEIQHEGDYRDGKRNGFQYSYSGEIGNRWKYNTCFYKNDTLVYNLWAADHASTVYHNGWAMKYFLYPKSKCDSSGGKLINGKKEGLWRRYYYNGNLEYIGEYGNDRKHGLWKEYYENGKLSEEYICDCKKEGGWIVSVISKHDTSGNNLDVGNFKDGVGKLIEYYPSGKIENEEFYSKIDCPDYKKYFSEQGILIQEEYFKNCEKDGKQKQYHDNGKTSSELTYKSGEPNGLFISYYEDGTIESRGIYKNVYGSMRYKLWRLFPQHRFWRTCGTGRQLAQHKQGKWTEYDSTGKLLTIETYKYGEQNGYSIYYYTSGVKKKEMKYKNGLKNGKAKEYTEQGILVTAYKYKWGNLIEETEYLPNGKIKNKKVYPIDKEAINRRKRRMKY